MATGSTADLKPMFYCLKSNPNPSSKRKLTSEAESALVMLMYGRTNTIL